MTFTHCCCFESLQGHRTNKTCILLILIHVIRMFALFVYVFKPYQTWPWRYYYDSCFHCTQVEASELIQYYQLKTWIIMVFLRELCAFFTVLTLLLLPSATRSGLATEGTSPGSSTATFAASKPQLAAGAALAPTLGRAHNFTFSCLALREDWRNGLSGVYLHCCERSVSSVGFACTAVRDPSTQ